MSRKLVFVVALTGISILATALVADAGGPVTRRLSVGSNEAEGDQESSCYVDDLSDDGTRAAFHSDSELAFADENGFTDVYIRDVSTGKTRLASIRNNGSDANGSSDGPAISGNGRVIAFKSLATNLVRNDENGAADIFVRDLAARKTERVSIATNGTEAGDVENQPALSFTGRFVAFATASQLVAKDDNHVSDVYLRDRKAKKTRIISVDSNGNSTTDGNSLFPTLSRSGRYVAFESDSDDLIPNDENNSTDIFRRDRKTGKTRRLSVATNGSQLAGNSVYASISADGHLIAFQSGAEFSPDDDNGYDDVYLRNMNSGTTSFISRTHDGEDGDQESLYPSLSANGRMVGFYSFATNLFPDFETPLYTAYVFDRVTGNLKMVDRDSNGVPGDGVSWVCGMSADGRFVMLSSESTLVVNDENNVADIFRRGPLY